MWENIWDIKLVTTETRMNYLLSEPYCHTTKFFKENILAIKMKKIDTYEQTCLFNTSNTRIK